MSDEREKQRLPDITNTSPKSIRDIVLTAYRTLDDPNTINTSYDDDIATFTLLEKQVDVRMRITFTDPGIDDPLGLIDITDMRAVKFQFDYYPHGSERGPDRRYTGDPYSQLSFSLKIEPNNRLDNRERYLDTQSDALSNLGISMETPLYQSFFLSTVPIILQAVADGSGYPVLFTIPNFTATTYKMKETLEAQGYRGPHSPKPCEDYRKWFHPATQLLPEA